MTIFPNTNQVVATNTGHPLFKAVETRFNNWFAHMATNTNEYVELYEGTDCEDAQMSKAGAVEQGVLDAIEYANDEGSPVRLSAIDVEASFE